MNLKKIIDMYVGTLNSVETLYKKDDKETKVTFYPIADIPKNLLLVKVKYFSISGSGFTLRVWLDEI